MTAQLHRMLYATDLSADSIEAMRYAVNYADRHNAKLIILHVINQRSITCSKMLSNFFDLDQEHKIRQEKISAALKRMENLLELIREKEFGDHPEYINKVEDLVAHCGRIAEEIVEKANRWGCELIILGPLRKGFFGRTVLPGISRKVIRRTNTSVHVIKLSKGEKP